MAHGNTLSSKRPALLYFSAALTSLRAFRLGERSMPITGQRREQPHAVPLAA